VSRCLTWDGPPARQLPAEPHDTGAMTADPALINGRGARDLPSGPQTGRSAKPQQRRLWPLALPLASNATAAATMIFSTPLLKLNPAPPATSPGPRPYPQRLSREHNRLAAVSPDTAAIAHSVQGNRHGKCSRPRSLSALLALKAAKGTEGRDGHPAAAELPGDQAARPGERGIGVAGQPARRPAGRPTVSPQALPTPPAGYKHPPVRTPGSEVAHVVGAGRRPVAACRSRSRSTALVRCMSFGVARRSYRLLSTDHACQASFMVGDAMRSQLPWRGIAGWRRELTVADTPAPDRRQHEVAVSAHAEAPVMPAIVRDSLWRSPNLIPAVGGQRHTLGWQDARQHGPCFVLARIGFVGEKILDRFPLTEQGWAQAWAALAALDPAAAGEVAKVVKQWLAAHAAKTDAMQRQADMYEALVSAGGATVFRSLGVQVLVPDGKVYTIGYHNSAAKTDTSQLLGPLAGAQAMVTDGAQAWSPGRAMFLPVGLTGLATKTKADAAVVFPDGTVHTVALDGNNAVREAQKQVVQFNALAGASAVAATETGGDAAAKLRKIQELRDAGVLTQEEYETKRARVIDSI
jgi:hypothetical protein